MKKVKAIIFSIVLLSAASLALANTEWANEMQTSQPTSIEKPAQCPSAESLIKAGLDEKALFDGYFSFIALKKSKFDTNDNWAFGIGVPYFEVNYRVGQRGVAMCKAAHMAHDIAISALPTLIGHPEPVLSGAINKWVCIYEVEEGYVVGAVTPADMPADIVLLPECNK